MKTGWDYEEANALRYIAGYVIKSLMKKVECQGAMVFASMEMKLRLHLKNSAVSESAGIKELATEKIIRCTFLLVYSKL